MMSSKKQALLSTVVFFAVLLFSTATIIREEEKNAPSLDVIVEDSPIVFYFGYNCPHCERVEEYLEENKVAEKISFSQKEVYKNADNADEALARAAQCGIGPDQLGVPFLWDGQKCYEGDENIINFFKEKVRQTEEGEAAAGSPEAAPSAQSLGTESAEEAPAETSVEEGKANIFYFSPTCSHCKAVEDYIRAHRIEEKIDFMRRDVTSGRKAGEDFVAKATGCGATIEALGTPMFYAGGKCYFGESQIINFFKEQTDEQ